MMKNRSAFSWVDFGMGMLFLALGIVLLLSPQLVLSGMVVVLGIAVIISGLADIVLYARLRGNDGFDMTPSLVTGIVGVAAGVLLLLYPVVGKWVFNIVIPLWFIVRCISRIAGFGILRLVAGRAISLIMLCLNILGLLLGIVMLFNQALFTMSLGVLVALDLMIMGVSNVLEAFGGLAAPDMQ